VTDINHRLIHGHSGDYLAEMLMACLKDYGIDDKVHLLMCLLLSLTDYLGADPRSHVQQHRQLLHHVYQSCKLASKLLGLPHVH
jgi:hypothetical protein